MIEEVQSVHPHSGRNRIDHCTFQYLPLSVGSPLYPLEASHSKWSSFLFTAWFLTVAIDLSSHSEITNKVTFIPYTH